MRQLLVGLAVFLGGGAAALAVAGYLGAAGLVLVGLAQIVVVLGLVRAS